MKKTVAVIIATATVCGMTAGCTPKEEKIEVNASTSPYEDMVDYFEQEGFILEDCEPVDINETTGYLTDNTNGEFTETKVADKAYDYDGLWLFWWDQENKTDLYGNYESMAANQGTIVLAGGAAVLETEAANGAYAIAFQRTMKRNRTRPKRLKRWKTNSSSNITVKVRKQML